MSDARAASQERPQPDLRAALKAYDKQQITGPELADVVRASQERPQPECNNPRHDEIESWYRQALAISQDRTDILSDVTAEGLLRLLAKAYMRGHSNGRNSNAPPNPKVAVEALLAKIVEDHDAR